MRESPLQMVEFPYKRSAGFVPRLLRAYHARLRTPGPGLLPSLPQRKILQSPTPWPPAASAAATLGYWFLHLVEIIAAVSSSRLAVVLGAGLLAVRDLALLCGRKDYLPNRHASIKFHRAVA